MREWNIKGCGEGGVWEGGTCMCAGRGSGQGGVLRQRKGRVEIIAVYPECEK